MNGWTIPYQSAVPGAPPRPNLVLHLTGPNGQSGDIPGIVDSEADCTSLPLGYAAPMGYDKAALAEEQVVTAGGTATAYVAQEPVDAYVVGLPEIPFELWPSFGEDNQMVLWGRHDFFLTFGVYFDEAAQQFTLLRPDTSDNEAT